MATTRWFLSPLVLALGALAAGCGPDIQGLCETKEGCLGGNAADIEACVAAEQFKIDVADIEGCTDEHEAYFACFYDKAGCTTSDTNTPCSDDKTCKDAGLAVCTNGKCVEKKFSLETATDCETERNAYDKCQ